MHCGEAAGRLPFSLSVVHPTNKHQHTIMNVLGNTLECYLMEVTSARLIRNLEALELIEVAKILLLCMNIVKPGMPRRVSYASRHCCLLTPTSDSSLSATTCQSCSTRTYILNGRLHLSRRPERHQTIIAHQIHPPKTTAGRTRPRKTWRRVHRRFGFRLRILLQRILSCLLTRNLRIILFKSTYAKQEINIIFTKRSKRISTTE